MHPPHQCKANGFGRKITLNFGEDLFFFSFFGDHLILGGKNDRSSDFGPKITLNFGEDIQIFEGLCLKSPPHQNFLDPPLWQRCVAYFIGCSRFFRKSTKIASLSKFDKLCKCIHHHHHDHMLDPVLPPST